MKDYVFILKSTRVFCMPDLVSTVSGSHSLALGVFRRSKAMFVFIFFISIAIVDSHIIGELYVCALVSQLHVYSTI